MNIINVVELDEYGVDINEPSEFATHYFDDNGGWPDGNYDEDNLEGKWLLTTGKQDNFETYAYRSIDDCTLVPVSVFTKDKRFINNLFFNSKEDGGCDFVNGIEWGKLAEHYNIELAGGGIGWDNPARWTSNPNLCDYHYYCKTVNDDQYIVVDGEGDHELIDVKNADDSLQFP